MWKHYDMQGKSVIMGSGHGRRNGRIGAYGWVRICTHVDAQSQVECPCNHIGCVEKGEEDIKVFKNVTVSVHRCYYICGCEYLQVHTNHYVGSLTKGFLRGVHHVQEAVFIFLLLIYIQDGRGYTNHAPLVHKQEKGLCRVQL